MTDLIEGLEGDIDLEEKILKKRQDIPDEFKWKMEDMFATDELWEEEVQQVEDIAKNMKQFAGKLDDAKNLLSFFMMSDDLLYHGMRVYVYANQRLHQDTAVSKYQAYAAKADSILVCMQSATAFSNPEILAIDSNRLDEFYKEEPGLLKYRRAIEVIVRNKDHVLSSAEENILALAGDLAVGPDNIYSMFNNADLKFPTIRDVEGNTIQITHGNFIHLLNSSDRGLRHEAFTALYDTYKKFGNMISTTFVSHLKQEAFFARVRKYDSVRAMHLAEGHIPESVYDNLIETVHKHLPAMHKYVALRKKMLGVDKLHMYDIYVPIVEDADKKISYEEAKETVIKALEPMGSDYVKTLKDGFENGWIDVYENENKRSGAYSWGAYGTHPYVLLNHQDNLDSMFTLAHEMGHAMHTYYSSKEQPVTYAEYLIFVAEVASTCNESLLMQYLLKNTTDKKERLYLINHYLDGFRTTLFRQAMFAEFETIVHKRLWNGESLTQQDLNQIYHDLNVTYYGPDMVVDEEIDYEWMRIPHFYTSFYVYQYATGYSAAVAFSKKILEEGQPAVDRYIKEFLSGGCSKDPIDLLKNAGVDMSTPQPIDEALGVFEEFLNIFEQES